MPRVQRSSDVIEIHSERAVTGGIVMVATGAIAALLLYYHGSTNMFVPLGLIFLLISLAGLGYAGYSLSQIRHVKFFTRVCPYCQTGNALSEEPTEDFLCVECNRLVPIDAGNVVEVHQVRCGYCNALNYYSDKTEILLCESCNHEIPIARGEDTEPAKKVASAYVVDDDNRPYELVLVAHGSRTEELVDCLQHMLALNRNQVKQMLAELPVTLLTGIPKRKAEMLRAQLSVHDAAADCRPLANLPAV